MILLWGVETDTPLISVRAALVRLGLDPVFLDQQTVLDTELELDVGSAISGAIRSGKQIIDLGGITSAYLRPYDPLAPPCIARAGPGSTAWRHALEASDTLMSWADLAPAVIVNRPTAMAPNNCKPLQAAQIQAFGFDVPESLLTTDPAAVREFQATRGTVIYKSTSGIRSIVSRLTSSHDSRLDDLRWCPTLFQRYVPGTEYRVHVVGDDVFACEIVSSADDYRYASRQHAAVDMHRCDLDDECAERCRAMVRAMQLLVAGIELRRSPDGRWFCFEVNPSPGFTFYEDGGDHSIAEAIARVLSAPSEVDWSCSPSG